MGKVLGPFSYTTLYWESTTRTMSPLKYIRHENKCEIVMNETRPLMRKETKRLKLNASDFQRKKLIFNYFICFFYYIIYSFIHNFIHSLIHSFTHPIHSFAHPLIHSFSHACIYSFSHSVIHSIVRLFIHSLISSLIC